MTVGGGPATDGVVTLTYTDSDLAFANVPADITTPATSANGATVTYTNPSVTDEDSPAPTVSCSPASGSTFAAGMTTVTCTASVTDDLNSHTASFSVTVNKVTPTISTQASPAVTVGKPISDTATLSGGASPTGTITFDVFGPNDATCALAHRVSHTTVAVSHGNGAYPSAGFTPSTGGTYRFIASYGGDGGTNAVSGHCGDANESVNVAAQGGETDTFTTQATPTSARTGSTIRDTATLGGPAGPTGSITFNLYGPADTTCAASPVFASTVAVNHGTGTYTSGPYSPSGAGTYRWVAFYSGDATHPARATLCSDNAEHVQVTSGTG
jgi:hypothetical protein